MKVAICISGHLRTFDRCFWSIFSKLIEPNNADVFIHTWETLGYNGPVDGTAPQYNTFAKEKCIDAMYRPKKMIIEDSKGFEHFKAAGEGYSEKWMKVHPGFTFAMFYSIWRANLLKIQYENENQFKYDVVVRCRPDLIIDHGVMLERFLNNNPLDAVFTPAFGSYGGANDQFAFSSSAFMNIYSELYSMIPNHVQHGCGFRPESLLAFHLARNGLPVKRCGVRYNIFRFSGELVSQQENSQHLISEHPYQMRRENYK